MPLAPYLRTSLQLATRTVPIVFVNVADAVGAGFVSSLAKPSGNITGFTNIEYSIRAKWLELLRNIAFRVTRVGVIRTPPQPLRSVSSMRSNPWRRRLEWS